MANTFFPKEINCQVTVERHFHGFSSFDGEQLVKICQHHWKVAKFESDLLKTNKDLAPEGRGSFKRFIHGGHEPAPHHTNVSVLFRDFVELYLTFSLNISPLTLVSYPSLRSSFEHCQRIFAYCSLLIKS